MKSLIITKPAQRNLLRHGNVSRRILQALAEYAADQQAHANNVTELIGEPHKRMRVGDYRAIFDETETEIIVLKVAPRGDVYGGDD